MIRENYEAFDDGQQVYEGHKVLHRWLRTNEFAHWPSFIKSYFLQQFGKQRRAQARTYHSFLNGILSCENRRSFLAMLSAIGASTIGKFLEDNPSSAAFVGIPQSSYESFEPEKILSINAFKFGSKDSKETYIHHRFAPSAGL